MDTALRLWFLDVQTQGGDGEGRTVARQGKMGSSEMLSFTSQSWRDAWTPPQALHIVLFSGLQESIVPGSGSWKEKRKGIYQFTYLQSSKRCTWLKDSSDNTSHLAPFSFLIACFPRVGLVLRHFPYITVKWFPSRTFIWRNPVRFGQGSDGLFLGHVPISGLIAIIQSRGIVIGQTCILCTAF